MATADAGARAAMGGAGEFGNRSVGLISEIYIDFRVESSHFCELFAASFWQFRQVLHKVDYEAVFYLPVFLHKNRIGVTIFRVSSFD